MRHVTLPFLVLLGTTGLQAQMVQKCCGTSNSTFLLGNLTTASHSQTIYTPSDLANEQDGEITRVYYRYGSTGQALGNTLTDFMIRLVQTSATAFAGGNLFFTGLDTVYVRPTEVIAPGNTGDWFFFNLGNTFTYDETLTLVVDISFTGSATTNFGTSSTSLAGRKLYSGDNSSPTGQSVVSSYQDFGFDLLLPTSIDGVGRTPFRLLPNPAADHVQLFLQDPLTEAATLTVRDAIGRTVRQQRLAAGSIQSTVDLKGLADGLHFVTIDTPDSHTVQRLVVAR